MSLVMFETTLPAFATVPVRSLTTLVARLDDASDKLLYAVIIAPPASPIWLLK